MATVALTKDNFQETIDNNDIVLVDFWASWCGPCQMFGPIFEEAAERHPGIVFGKVDTEDQPELASAFEIMSIPTLMAFREKVILYSQPGALPSELLDELITKVNTVDMADVHQQVADALAEDEGKVNSQVEG